MAEKFTLYSPDGDKYVTSSKVERTRLVNAHGYSTEAPKSSKPASDKK